MKVVFRVDSGNQIGIGHVMRCLTLANYLHQNHAVSIDFICRPHPNAIMTQITERGYPLHMLQRPQQLASDGVQPNYLHWLGSSWRDDAEETKRYVTALGGADWLIVDHYGIDSSWHQKLRATAKKVMVIDDLANRQYDCDLLLDQTFGRAKRDYQNLTPTHCTRLVGSRFALLRPEFAALRDYSVKRRQNFEFKQLLITLGGVDKDNVTSDVLRCLQHSNLPQDCRIVVVMGINAPWIDVVKQQAAQMNWHTDVRVGVQNMAQVIADSDLCIGAAGSTTWERCCLGLPTIMLVLAENQYKIATELARKRVVEIANDTADLPVIIQRIQNKAYDMSQKSFNVTNGQGTRYLQKEMVNIL